MGPEATFKQYVRSGKLMLQRSRASGRHYFYPRAAVADAGPEDLEWVPATGRGIVYATTIVRQKRERGGDYNISLVELEEGPRLMTRVLGLPPGSIQIGMRVTAHIEQPTWDGAGADPVVVFYAADGGAGNDAA